MQSIVLSCALAAILRNRVGNSLLAAMRADQETRPRNGLRRPIRKYGDAMQVTFRERRVFRWPRQRMHTGTLAAADIMPLAVEALNPAEREHTALRRLIGLCRPYRSWLAGGSFCLVLAGALGLVLPWVVRGLIDNVLGTDGMGALWQALVALVAIAVAQAVFTFGQGFLLSYAGERLVADLRSRLYRHLQRLSVGFFDGRRVGELLSGLTNDVSAVQQAITNGLFSSLQ